MDTIINISSVTDHSGEPPVVTYSNPVNTVIRQNPPTPVITRIFYCLPCTCRCGCCCNCDCCRDCDDNF